MSDLNADAVRVAAELRAAAPFLPTLQARLTLSEAARLLGELADVEDRADQLAHDLRAAEHHAEGLRRALEIDWVSLRDGLYLVRRDEGSLSRRWVPQASDEQLDRLLPRAALLRHHEAVTDALLGMLDEVRASVQRDAQGVPVQFTWPAAASWAGRILAEIGRHLPPPAVVDGPDDACHMCGQLPHQPDCPLDPARRAG